MRTASFYPARRAILTGAVALAAFAPFASAFAAADPYAASPWRKLTDADWKKRLPPASFDILRRDGTETAFTSPLNDEHRAGTFVCFGCGLPLFKSQWKFNSGTGWPSFYTSIKGAMAKKQDHLLGFLRTEYHCARCLGHQGHIFDDGPKPTGLRYCNDGVALKFVAA
ncbi:MAG: peptide-methionine (R)-S-oxide reductase MsrB [Pseudomonadota bacterium]|nr:peptide-methionine (R)-S-oxide reductase MsrB [Pseudomonadota bacterium]